ncbi:MAG: class I SAM-dependent methyltransferase [Bacteroidales bacterium]
MKIANECIICKEKLISKKKAIVVPFLAERIFHTKAFSTNLIRCKNCGFQFYSLRPDEDEMIRLYNDYRGESYIKQRFKYEPWYTKRLNDSLFFKSSTLIKRRNSLIEQLEIYKPGISQSLTTVLDYGGDKGQLIEGIFNHAKKFVYEISNVELLPGIEKATYPSSMTFDFIICSNVLEHVSYPTDILDKITRMAHDNTVIYLEVPYEQPYSADTLVKRIIQQTVLLFLRPRQFFITFGRGMFTHMHEHLNYFSEKSLQLLLKEAGYKKAAVKVATINNANYFCCFATKTDH